MAWHKEDPRDEEEKGGLRQYRKESERKPRYQVWYPVAISGIVQVVCVRVHINPRICKPMALTLMCGPRMHLDIVGRKSFLAFFYSPAGPETLHFDFPLILFVVTHSSHGNISD